VSFKDFNATIEENTPNSITCLKKTAHPYWPMMTDKPKNHQGKNFDINIVLSRQV